jgi:hypothetical protein
MSNMQLHYQICRICKLRNMHNMLHMQSMQNNMSMICNIICRTICRIYKEICQIICTICRICNKTCNKICKADIICCIFNLQDMQVTCRTCMKPQTHTSVVLIFCIFYVFCYILHIPKCCAPGLPAVGRPGVKLHILPFFILHIFLHIKTGGVHILHIFCIFVAYW